MIMRNLGFPAVSTSSYPGKKYLKGVTKLGCHSSSAPPLPSPALKRVRHPFTAD